MTITSTPQFDRSPRKALAGNDPGYTDPDYVDAHSLVQSAAFRASSANAERPLIVFQSPIDGLLDDLCIKERYNEALVKLDQALTVEVVASMKKALGLAGITDAGLIDEICRCVTCGGDLFDGKNLRKRAA